MQLNRDNSKKLYVQLYEDIRQKIDDGEWPEGAQIPVEDELCRRYAVSKATVRLAILELVRQGFLSRQQGKGTFVCKRVSPHGLLMTTSFEEFMFDAGTDFTTELLAQTVMMPTDDLDVKLGVSEDTHIIYIKRRCLAAEEPLLLQEAYIPYPVAPKMLDEDLEHSSLIHLLESKHGIRFTGVRNYFEVAHLTEEEGKLLGMQKGAPALLLAQHFHSGETRVMYSRSVKKPEMSRIMIEFERKQ